MFANLFAAQERDPYRFQFYDEDCLLHLRELSDVKTISSFEEQRDLDNSRIDAITDYYEYQLNKYGTIRLTNPIIIVKCRNHEDFLIDKDKKRCNECIVDGQHRVEAFRKWNPTSQRIENVNKIRIPVLIHHVNTISEARIIQYNLFQQKPVADIDRIQQSRYSLADQIDRCIREWKKLSPDIGKKYIREGRYNDPKRRFRKFHFLPDECLYYLSNHDRISEWVTREVQGEEIYHAMNSLVTKLYSTFIALEKSEQKKFVHIPRDDHLEMFCKMMENHNHFSLLCYHYFKKYQKLVDDLVGEILPEMEYPESDSE